MDRNHAILKQLLINCSSNILYTECSKYREGLWKVCWKQLLKTVTLYLYIDIFSTVSISSYLMPRKLLSFTLYAVGHSCICTIRFNWAIIRPFDVKLLYLQSCMILPTEAMHIFHWQIIFGFFSRHFPMYFILLSSYLSNLHLFNYLISIDFPTCKCNIILIVFRQRRDVDRIVQHRSNRVTCRYEFIPSTKPKK